jgi:plasmid stability protein
MTRNITLSLDDEILREARVLAAHQGLSVSGLLRRQLVHMIESERGYAKARASALHRLGRGLSLEAGKLPSRAELHDRAGLR